MKSFSLDADHLERSLLERLTAFRLLRLLEVQGEKMIPELTALPDELCRLTSLAGLRLHLNVTGLPEGLGRLTGLECLVLECPNVTSLPDSLFSLTNLTCLVLYQVQVECLSDRFGCLAHLKHLSLWSLRELNCLPGSVSQLSGLETLNVWGERLTALPIGEGELPALREVQLHPRMSHLLPAHVRCRRTVQEVIESRYPCYALDQWCDYYKTFSPSGAEYWELN